MESKKYGIFFYFQKGEIPPAFDRCWTTLYDASEQFTATTIYNECNGYNVG